MTHPFKNKFSFPFNTIEILKLYKEDCELAWFKHHAEIINEVYIDPIIFGFYHNDMNGSSVDYTELKDVVLTILKKLKSYDIKISVILNNVFEDDITTEDVERLIENKHIIDNLVLPSDRHVTELKKHFYVKNTVILDPKIDEIYAGQYSEFDMIYVHDSVVQNLEKFKELKRNIPNDIGTVVNFEMCYASCPHKRKHYKFISRKQETDVDFCKPTTMPVLERLLKISNIPPLYSEYLKFVDVLDIFKLQGRNGQTQNWEFAINLIEMIFDKEKSIKFNTRRFPRYHRLNIIPLTTIRGWLTVKSNCGGDCEDCDYCDDIIAEYGDL